MIWNRTCDCFCSAVQDGFISVKTCQWFLSWLCVELHDEKFIKALEHVVHVSLNIQTMLRLFDNFYPAVPWLTPAFNDQIWLTSLAFPSGRWYLFICLVSCSSSAAHYFFTLTGGILRNGWLSISGCQSFMQRDKNITRYIYCPVM